MKVLTRYLLRSHIAPFFFAFLALTGVVLINTLARELANLAGKGLATEVFFEFFVLSLPANVALTLPMAVLVAVLYTFSQFAAENEITALKASGIDLRRMVMPLLAAAALVAGGMVWFNDQVLPASNYRWRMLMMDVAQTSPLLSLKEQVVNPIGQEGSTSLYLQASRIYQGSNRMRDVAIYDVSNPEAARTIYADSGWVAMNRARTDLVLTLFDGHIRQVDTAQPETFQRIAFERQVMRIPGIMQQMQRTEESSFRTDRDMTVAMMSAKIDTMRSELQTLRKAQAMAPSPSPETKVAISTMAREENYDEARIRNLRFSIREYQVEVHKKFAIATATMVFVLIGVPLALRFPRGGVGMVIGASLLIFSIYYVGLIGGEALADEGLMPPSLAMWQTNVIFGTLGLFAMWRIGREQSTGRGAGWGDLPRWLRRPMLRRRRIVEA
ncbi:MAG: LptF/LptG family permease [Gemmatimonadetes bacterium]|nr:LptF/LptG family permease [Gemmatimonadota bacterium]